jgi:hypothetical protein
MSAISWFHAQDAKGDAMSAFIILVFLILFFSYIVGHEEVAKLPWDWYYQPWPDAR